MLFRIVVDLQGVVETDLSLPVVVVGVEPELLEVVELLKYEVEAVVVDDGSSKSLFEEEAESSSSLSSVEEFSFTIESLKELLVVDDAVVGADVDCGGAADD